jgi:hypothetical protein
MPGDTFARRSSGRTLPRKGLITIFCRTISRVPSGREPFAACTFNGRLSLKRSWFVCCAGAFSMSLSIFAARHLCTLEPDTVIFYKVDQVYSPTHDGGINWADPRLGIEWPVASEEAILPEKDRGLPNLADLGPLFE